MFLHFRLMRTYWITAVFPAFGGKYHFVGDPETHTEYDKQTAGWTVIARTWKEFHSGRRSNSSEMHRWATPIKSISSDYVSIPVQLTAMILGCFFCYTCVVCRQAQGWTTRFAEWSQMPLIGFFLKHFCNDVYARPVEFPALSRP